MKIIIDISPEEALQLTGAEFFQKLIQEQVKESINKATQQFDPLELMSWFPKSGDK